MASNSETLLRMRYYLKDKDGNIKENWDNLCERVAVAISGVELIYDCRYYNKFYDIMSKKYFLPNSPTLMNAGLNYGTLFACFVLGIEDSIKSIFKTVYDVALITKMGGGVGITVSNIRPQDSDVKGVGIASGPISFMSVFNNVIEVMRQGNRRRGAMLASIRDDHPDVIDFINSKLDEKSLNNFNISVSITDKFMHSVIKDEKWDLVDHKDKVVEIVNARDIYNKLVHNAWSNGEPGILFIDRINRDNAVRKAYGDIYTTNVCGEVPAINNSACVLGSIDLAKMIKDGKVDYNLLGYVIENGIRFLDNTIDVSKYPNNAIKNIVKNIRPIGLGIMGFAKMLLEMKIRYGSDECLKLINEIMSFIKEKSIETSLKIGKEKGSFPVIDNSIYAGKTMRNSTLLSIAPTGSISIIAETSSEVEPFFSPYNIRKTFEGQIIYEKNFDNNYQEVGDEFVTSHDIDGKTHIDVQAEFTKYIDGGISKTINLPYNATEEEVYNLFIYAWKKKCKGITIYRDGSRKNQVLTKKA